MAIIAVLLIAGIALLLDINERNHTKLVEAPHLDKNGEGISAETQNPSPADTFEAKDETDLQGAGETSDDADTQYRRGMVLLQRSWEREEPYAMLESVDLIRQAAEKEHAQAQYVLGALYEKGRGLIQDYERARGWYLRAAHQGSAQAMSRLGELFARGHGVEQNLGQAYVWLNLASARGDRDAEGERNKIQRMMSITELEAAQESSRELDITLPHLVEKSKQLPFNF